MKCDFLVFIQQTIWTISRPFTDSGAVEHLYNDIDRMLSVCKKSLHKIMSVVMPATPS